MARFVFAGAALALLCLTACTRVPDGQTKAQQDATAVEAEAPEPKRQDLSATIRVGQAVVIDNPYGSVYLRFGGYQHEVGIHATLQQPEGAAKIIFQPREENGRYMIAPKLPGGAILAEGQRLDLVVYVPERHSVTVRTGNGSIESRGIKGDLDLKTLDGNIAARGTEGSLQVETDSGAVELAMTGAAPHGSHQRIATRTGNIVLGITDSLDARIQISTSGVIGTEFTLEVTHKDGEEPDKWANATIGAPNAEVVLESKRGDIRLLRRAVYIEVEDPPPEASQPG